MVSKTIKEPVYYYCDLNSYYICSCAHYVLVGFSVQIQHRVEFNQLVHLELCSSVEKWCELLNWMLESSPKLKVLKLNKVYI